MMKLDGTEKRNDMNIQKYQALIKVIEYGSFTKAAEALNYTQSGISRMVNELETKWGFPYSKGAQWSQSNI